MLIECERTRELIKMTEKCAFIDFNELKQSGEFLEDVGFDGFTYGDSAGTLMCATEFIKEVSKDAYPDLYRDLELINSNVWVAL